MPMISVSAQAVKIQLKSNGLKLFHGRVFVWLAKKKWKIVVQPHVRRLSFRATLSHRHNLEPAITRLKSKSVNRA